MEPLSLSRAEILAVLPAGFLFITGLIQLLSDLGDTSKNSRHEKTHLAMIGATGALVAFASLFVQGTLASTGELYAGAMTDDLFGRLGAGVIIVTSLFVTLMSGGYLSSSGNNKAEFHSLINFSAGAMVLLCQATNLVSIFVAIETLSLAVYVLAGFYKENKSASEGAFKYFIMGAFSSGFLLFGMALVYGLSGGSLSLSGIAASGASSDALFAVGVLLVLIGF